MTAHAKSGSKNRGCSATKEDTAHNDTALTIHADEQGGQEAPVCNRRFWLLERDDGADEHRDECAKLNVAKVGQQALPAPREQSHCSRVWRVDRFGAATTEGNASDEKRRRQRVRNGWMNTLQSMRRRQLPGWTLNHRRERDPRPQRACRSVEIVRVNASWLVMQRSNHYRQE